MEDTKPPSEALMAAYGRTSMGVAFARTDESGATELLAANRAFANLTGRDPCEAMGLDLLELFPSSDRPRRGAEIAAIAGGSREIASTQARLQRGDGELRTVELELLRLGEDDAVGACTMLALMRDLTDDMREAEARRTREIMTEVLATASSVEGAIAALLPALAEELGFAFAAAWRVDDGSGELRCTASWEAPGKAAASSHMTCQVPLPRGARHPGKVWDAAAPAWATHVPDDPSCARAGAAGEGGLHTALAFPLFVGPQLEAVIELVATEPRDRNQLLLRTLADLAEKTSGMLARKRAQERGSGAGHLLLVEDNALVARLVRDMLSEQQSELQFAHVGNLAEARLWLAQSTPACVLLDLTLDDAEGLQALRAIRAITSTVPIVVLTGIDDEDLAVQAMQEGAQDYLVKRRVDIQGLTRAVRYAIERKHVEAQTLTRGLHEPLSGLPNRVLFFDRLRVALARSGRGEVAVVIVNLDRFRVMNDSLGYHVADSLLLAVVERIERTIPPGATVASFGGDEFAVLLEETTAEAALATATTIVDAVSGAYDLHGHRVHVTCSGGIANSHGSSVSAETLVARAGTALTRAKEIDDTSCEVFDEAVKERLRSRLTLDTELRAAIEREELCLHYQPLVMLDTRAVIGFEALVRWRHPERGLLPPGSFLPLAEEQGLIVPIGRWALQEATRQLRRWDASRERARSLVMNVNLSARELADDALVDVVAAALSDTGLAPERLCLEVTETGLIGDIERSSERLASLRALGVRLALDDFGTGYSSLSHLSRLPVDILKLDRSFVHSMCADRGSPIVAAVANMANALGLTAVAEGVETEAELRQLEGFGYGFGQGYLFGRPVPGPEAEMLIIDPLETT